MTFQYQNGMESLMGGLPALGQPGSVGLVKNKTMIANNNF